MRPQSSSGPGRLGFVNTLEIRQIGMSRSGNHALLNWIVQQARGRICFLNCTEPATNPFRTARPLDDGGVAVANYPDFDLAGEQQGRLTRKDVLLFSHEDCFLGSIGRAGGFERCHDRWIGRSRRRVDVLLLRDPFNLFASRIRGMGSHGASSTALRIWKQHARQFLGLRGHLREDHVLVSYNRWVTDAGYRRDVAVGLGLPFTDAGRLEVPSVAAGSSFDGRAFDGDAARMPVFERWRWLRRNSRHVGIFDREVVDLAERTFGDVCGPELGELLGSLRN